MVCERLDRGLSGGAFFQDVDMPYSIPRTDPGILMWAQNVYSVASPNPQAYGLNNDVLAAFEMAIAQYRSALAACDPGQRSMSSVAAKNAARAVLNRCLICLVEGSGVVTRTQKIELGIRDRSVRTPIPRPATSPTMRILRVDKWTVDVKLSDATNSGKRGKPDGTVGAAVFSHVGPTPPTELDAWRFEGNVGRVKFAIPFPATLPPGTRVWLAAQWFNNRKQAGPVCDPVATHLQGGSVATQTTLSQAA
jgi:hypothetical protein